MNLPENRVLFHQELPLGEGHAELYCGARCLGRGLISKRVNIEHATPMHYGNGKAHPGIWVQDAQYHPSGRGQMFGTAAGGEGEGKLCASCGRDLTDVPAKAGA